MKSLELKKQRESLLAEMEVLAKGTFDDAAQKSFAEKEGEVVRLNEEIKTEEKRESFLRARASESKVVLSDQDQKDVDSYSLLKAIREFKSGKLTGIEAEMHQEAERNNSTFGQGITGLGVPSLVMMNKKIYNRATLVAGSSVIVQTDNIGFIDALWAKTLVTQLGAKTLQGLGSNMDMPYLKTKPGLAWAATENAIAVDAVAELDKHQLTPKRMTNFIPVSKQLIMQSNKSVEQILWDALLKAAAVKIDAAAINGAGTTEPYGILNTTGIGSVAIGTDGGVPTLAKVLELIREVAVDNADIGSLAFLTNPQVRYKLQQTALISSTDSRTVWNVEVNDKLLGYRAGVTTQVPSTLDKGTSTGVCSALIFGNFNDITIGQFGAYDLILDDMTSAKYAMVNLIMHGWYDILIDHAESFSAVKDLTT
jgi:HK97 family phage major capsid protein